jgi:hypothetical protein
VQGQGWAANLDLLRRTAPLARRLETVALDARYDVRARESRIRPWSDGLAVFRARRAKTSVDTAPKSAPRPA